MDFRVDPNIEAAGMFSWHSQVRQYPEFGVPGISYFAGETPLGTVDCLLWRDDHGLVRGILNHYPIDFPPHEVAGNVNVWVQPEYQRQGIATRLYREAVQRWDISLAQQRFSTSGVELARYLHEQHGFG